VPLVNWLDRVSQVVQDSHESLEAPALATLLFPDLAVVLEWSETDQGVVTGAASEDLGTRMTDVRVAHGLFGGGVIIVELASEQVEPVLQQQDTIVHEIRRASFDEENLLVWEVFGESASDDTARGTAADDEKVIVVGSISWKMCSSRHDE